MNCRLCITDRDRMSLAAALKRELLKLDPGMLPLEQGTSRGGQVDHDNIDATVIEVHDHAKHIQARVGVFFNEIVGGCSCGDDPVAENAYCELGVRVDKATGEAHFRLIKG